MIIVEPPETPPAFVQQIERPLIECGLNREQIRIVLSSEHRRIEIHVPAPSDASADTISCLVRSGGIGRFLFEEDHIQHAYSAMLKLNMDQAYSSSARELVSQGIFEALPKRTNFENDVAFAVALENYCGITPGTALQIRDGSTIFNPTDISTLDTNDEVIAQRCIIAAFSLTGLEQDRNSWSDLEVKFEPIHDEFEE